MLSRVKGVICARIDETLHYRGIHPNLDLALECITEDFLSRLTEQSVNLKGDEVYCTKFTYSTVSDDESFFEAHANYLDIHIMLESSERIEIASITHLKETEAKPDSDFWAYQGLADYSLVLSPDKFLVLFPGEAHKLKLQVDKPRVVTKAVFKVKLSSS